MKAAVVLALLLSVAMTLSVSAKEKYAPALPRIYVLPPHIQVKEPLPAFDWKRSPNYGEREYGPIDTIVIHATAGGSTKGAQAVFAVPGSASSHIIIPDNTLPTEPKKTVRVVDDQYKSWHTLRSVIYRGRNDLNSRSLGIEIVNRCTPNDPYSDWQVQETARWCRYWISKYPIRWIVTHAYVDPRNRLDPCTTFPWQYFLALVTDKLDTPVQLEPVSFIVNGKPVEAGGTLYRGASWGELEPLFKAAGYRIKWDDKTRTVTIYRP